MNTTRTDRHAYEIDNRERYRRRLIACRTASAPRTRWWRDLDEPIGLLEAVELAVFAGGMLALIGLGLSWILAG